MQCDFTHTRFVTLHVNHKGNDTHINSITSFESIVDPDQLASDQNPRCFYPRDKTIFIINTEGLVYFEGRFTFELKSYRDRV